MDRILYQKRHLVTKTELKDVVEDIKSFLTAVSRGMRAAQPDPSTQSVQS